MWSRTVGGSELARTSGTEAPITVAPRLAMRKAASRCGPSNPGTRGAECPRSCATASRSTSTVQIERTLSVDAQHSDCSYIYTRSSAGLPSAAYQVTVTVTWGGTWVGSGATGGSLPALSRTTTFPLRVAEAQAVTGG